MQEVVQTLGDPEEPRVPLQDQPTRVDTCPAAIGQQRREHLRDPSTGGRRVHVPHDPTVQDAPCQDHVALEPPSTLRVQKSCQPLQRYRVDANLTHTRCSHAKARHAGRQDARPRRRSEDARSHVDKMPLAHPIDAQIPTFAPLAMSPVAGSLAAVRHTPLRPSSFVVGLDVPIRARRSPWTRDSAVAPAVPRLQLTES